MKSTGYWQRRAWRTIGMLLSAVLLASLSLSGNLAYKVAATNLVANGDFESSLSGWTGWEATLSRVTGGHTGTYAARATHSNTTSSFSINNNNPYTVASVVKGVTYTASAALRSAYSGHKLCLVLREKSPSGANLKDTGKCLTASSSWQTAAGLSATALNSGDALLVYAIDYDANKGHSFDLDTVVVTSNATSPTPTPTATATATPAPTATPTPTPTATPAPTPTPTPTATPSPTPTSGNTSYDQAISYTQTRAAFTPKRTVNVSSSSQLLSAISNLQAGDLVKATASFTVSGSTNISKKLSAPAVIDLTGYSVKFVYSGGQDQGAVSINNAQNLRIYGGDTTTSSTGGNCIKVYGAQYFTWWGFTAHDCGGDGFDAMSGVAATQHIDIQGTVWRVGLNLSWDPHTEKGSGLHCSNLDDNNKYAFSDNRFALYCHDIPVGAAIEYGAAYSTNVPVRNTVYLLAQNLTFVSKTQTGGNGIQIWGTNGQSLDVKFLEVDNAEGFGFYANGMNSGTTCNGFTVEYGRASNTNQNPRYAGQNPWDDATCSGIVYQNVLPAPVLGKT